MKIQLAAKFQKKMMDGYPALVRTDERTGQKTSLFQTKVGGLKRQVAKGWAGHLGTRNS